MSGWEGVSHCISRRLPISPVQLSAVNERGAGPHSEVVEGWTLSDKPGEGVLSAAACAARQHASLCHVCAGPPGEPRSQQVKSREIVIVWGEGAGVTMMGLGVGFLFHVPKNCVLVPGPSVHSPHLQRPLLTMEAHL